MADAETAPEAPKDTGDAPTTDAPAADAPGTDAPAADAPATDAPAADAPAADAPAADAPATDAPAAPATEAVAGTAATAAADTPAAPAEATAEATSEMPAATVTVTEKIVEVTAVPRQPVVYIEATAGQTRVVLLQDKGDRISVRDVGTSLDPLKDLGVGREDEDASALLQRRAEFAEFLGNILKSGQEVWQSCKKLEVVLGLSSWYTDLPDEDKASYEGMWDSIRQQVRENVAADAVVVLLPLPEDEEARHEHRAVAFAATQVQRLKPDFAGLVLGTTVPDAAKIRCTCGFAPDSPVLQLALSLEEATPMVEGGDDGVAKWQGQCKEQCTQIFSASKDVIAGVCASAAPPQVCALGGLLQGIAAPAALLGQQEVKEALEKLQAALGEAASAADKAAILRTAAALEALEGVVGSSLQVLFSQQWELGGSSFTASWSVGHYLKRPQGTKEVAQTDGPPPTASEAGAESTEKEGPVGPTADAATGKTDVAAAGGEAAETGEAAATADAEKPEVPGLPPTGTSEQLRPLETKPRIGPGFVVYVVAPNDDMPLSGPDFSAIRSAAVQSDATVVLSARSASSIVVEEGKKVAESNRVLRPLADFAVRRFSPAGSSKAGSHHSAFQHLFEAIVLSGQDAMYRSVVEGLQNLGFPGDAAAIAEALLPVGIPKVSKQEFCSSLADAFVHPEMVVVCPKNSKGAAEWPQVRTAHFPGTDMTGEAALKTKVAEAWKAAGRGGHGVILVLAARGRCSMAPADYERQMRQELQLAMEGLPGRWPLLWAPGPAEVGLFPIGCKQRSNWAMQQAYLAELPGWLRYLLVIRPSNS